MTDFAECICASLVQSLLDLASGVHIADGWIDRMAYVPVAPLLKIALDAITVVQWCMKRL